MWAFKTSSAIKEVQIKTIWTFYLSLVRLAIIKKTKNQKYAGKDIRKEDPYSPSLEEKLVRLLGKSAQRSL